METALRRTGGNAAHALLRGGVEVALVVGGTGVVGQRAGQGFSIT